MSADTVLPGFENACSLEPGDPYFDYLAIPGLYIGKVAFTENGGIRYVGLFTAGLLEWLYNEHKEARLGLEGAALLSSKDVSDVFNSVSTWPALRDAPWPIYWEYGSTEAQPIATSSQSPGTVAAAQDPPLFVTAPVESAILEEDAPHAASSTLSPAAIQPVEPVVHEASPFDTPSDNIAPESHHLTLQAEKVVEEPAFPTEHEVISFTLDDVNIEAIKVYVRLEYEHVTQADVSVSFAYYYPGVDHPFERSFDPETVRSLLGVDDAERLMGRAICEARMRTQHRSPAQPGASESTSVAVNSSAAEPRAPSTFVQAPTPSTPMLSRSNTASPLSAATPDEAPTPPAFWPTGIEQVSDAAIKSTHDRETTEGQP